MKSLCRNSGKYQWNASVAGGNRSGGRTGMNFMSIRLTVFCDDRDEAIRDVCDIASKMGLISPTVNHIVKIS